MCVNVRVCVYAQCLRACGEAEAYMKRTHAGVMCAIARMGKNMWMLS